MNLIIALSIPLCGYKGAQSDDKTMICWFCGCNVAEATWGVLMIFYITWNVEAVDQVCHTCEEDIGKTYAELIAMNRLV